jgi:DNA-binding winged helix-turn-helix (wHTH) protein/esterase/lipase
VVYEFGSFRIDTSRFEIARDGRLLPVEPQVLELLIALIEQRDRVVSRDALLQKVWKDRIVSDTTLSSRIKTARQLIGDDGTRQEFIRTIHGRGFRFVGPVQVASASLAHTLEPAARGASERPSTRYARSGDIHVAYQLFGGGPVNLVLAPGFVSHIDNYWDSAPLSRWLGGLGRLARVAMFDKRGTGLSDRVSTLPGMDERMDDLRAVMDGAGFATATIMGVSEGGSLAALYCAHHPARSDGLILYGSFAQFKHWLPDAASLQNLFDYIETDWGSGKSLPQFAPSFCDDPELVRWWGKFERLGATPGSAIALMKMNSQIDISDVLPTIQVPTLVIHVENDVLIDIQAGRELAARIPGAQYVELQGSDHLPFVGANAPRTLEAIARFLNRPRSGQRSDRALATVLLLQPGTGCNTAALDPGASAVASELQRFGATRICAQSPGAAAMFDGPARALECAVAISLRLQAANVDHRLAVHTGQVRLAGDLAGNAMDIARDVIARAGNNEILVSRTVNDLVAGSGIALEDRGGFDLPSIDQRWHLFRVVR